MDIKKYLLLPVAVSLLLFFNAAFAAYTGSKLWTDQVASPRWYGTVATQQVKPRYLQADTVQLKAVLRAAPLERSSEATSTIELPLPDGEMRRFVIEESPVMAPALAAKYPHFKTYRVRATDSPQVTGRADLLPTGFHAYITTEKGVVVINPERGYSDQYRSFYKHDSAAGKPRTFSCGVKPEQRGGSLPGDFVSRQPALNARIENELLTYRIAVAATYEYSQAVTSGVAGNVRTNTLAEIVTAINRVDEIYVRDLGIFLQLVANNDLLICTVQTPPCDLADNDPEVLLLNNYKFIESFIDQSDYDVGHVFSTGGGGLAGYGVVCDSDLNDPAGQYKADGVTGTDDPVGDAFYIDYVAHELGHQFGASHTFNGTTDNCGGGNRNAATAYEPGSGSTIMGYAGICGAEDVQTSADSPTAGGISDDTFHAGSIDEIVDYTRNGTGNTCDLLTSNTNSAPVVDAGNDFTIPGLTPFQLRGSATDSNITDLLTYQWDEMDVGRSTTATTYGTDLGTNPLFRSFAPTASADRTLPRMQTILSGVDDKAEKLPRLARTMHFRLSVRDQNSGLDSDDMQVAVDASSGPFKVLTATTPITLDVMQSQVIEWNAACTEQAPVNCASVDIQLSTDGGLTFSTLLAATANDGEALVDFPNVSSASAVIKIACSDNIFFAVSDSPITLEQGSGEVLLSTGAGGSYNCGTAPAVTPPFDLSDAITLDLPSDLSSIITNSVNDLVDVTDVFRITGNGGVYSFLLADFASSNLDLYLVDNAGKILLSSTGTSASELIRSTLADGTVYYLVIEAKDTAGATQSYSITVTRDDTPASSSGGSGGSLGIWLLLSMLAMFALRSRNSESSRRALIQPLFKVQYLSGTL
jgi:hypothetical protein